MMKNNLAFLSPFRLRGITTACISAIAFASICPNQSFAQSLLAFQESCAERGDSRRHAKVINPLQQYKIICDQPAKARQNLLTPPQTVDSDAITLCNWNVYGLPVQKSGRRQRNVANYVAYGCDIFLGQEHWSPLDRRGFRKRTTSRASDWTFRYFNHPLPVHPGSGIMIGSIWPIVKTQYSPWPGGLLKNAGYKGVGYAQIRTPQGLMDVFNLHLAAGRKLALKEEQVRHLTDFIRRTHASELPMVITGDFNFHRRWPLPSNQIKALEWLNQELGVRPVGFNTRIEHTLIDDQLEYLDHRLLADWASSREVYMSPSFIQELSDHPGVVTRVMINQKRSHQDSE